jgi:hypothetical protein
MKTKEQALNEYLINFSIKVDEELEKIQLGIELQIKRGCSRLDYGYGDRMVILEIVKKLRKLGYKVKYSNSLFNLFPHFNSWTDEYHITIKWR